MFDVENECWTTACTSLDQFARGMGLILCLLRRQFNIAIIFLAVTSWARTQDFTLQPPPYLRGDEVQFDVQLISLRRLLNTDC